MFTPASKLKCITPEVLISIPFQFVVLIQSGGRFLGTFTTLILLNYTFRIGLLNENTHDSLQL